MLTHVRYTSCFDHHTFLLAQAGMNVLSVLYVISKLVVFKFVGMQQIALSTLLGVKQRSCETTYCFCMFSLLLLFCHGSLWQPIERLGEKL